VKHPGKRPWYVKDKCGPFFVVYCEDEDVDASGIVSWYVCPDDEDKCTERSHVNGCASSVEEAMRQVAAAVSQIAWDVLAWVVDVVEAEHG